MKKKTTQESMNKLFALFVIAVFLTSGMSIEVYAPDPGDPPADPAADPAAPQVPEFDKNKPSTWDHYYNDPMLYATVDPNHASFNWNLAQYDKVRWDKVSDYNRVDMNQIPPGSYDQVRWDHVTEQNLQRIETRERIEGVVEHLSPQNVARLSGPQIVTLGDGIREMTTEQQQALTIQQLIGGSSTHPRDDVLQNLGEDISNLDSSSLNTALRHVVRGLSADVTIVPGVRYESGYLINPSFDCSGAPENCGLSLRDIAADPSITVVSAVKSEVPGAETKNGFLVCKASCSSFLMGKDFESVRYGPDRTDPSKKVFFIGYRDSQGVFQELPVEIPEEGTDMESSGYLEGYYL